MKTIEQMIVELIKREGGFVNHKNDRGGPTKYGVTQNVLSQWRGRKVSIDEVKALTEDQAASVYRDMFYRQPGIDRLPEAPPLREQVFDFGVNSGQSRAIRYLQTCLQAAGYAVDVDGKIGPQTVKAVEEAVYDGGQLLNNALVEARLQFFQEIVDRDPSQRVFLKGWRRRAEEFRMEED